MYVTFLFWPARRILGAVWCLACWCGVYAANLDDNAVQITIVPATPWHSQSKREDGPSALPPVLQPFDLNRDGVIDENEERVMRQALDTYFKDKKVDMHKVERNLKIIKECAKRETPILTGSEGEDSPSTSSSNNIQETIIQAIAASMHELQSEKDTVVKKSVTKKKALGATLITGLGGIASTLLVRYLTFKCDCE